MKIMKKNYYKIICAIGAMCGLSSCGDFLDIEPRELVIEEQFWNEKTDVDNVVAGCYEGLQSYSVVTRMMAWGEFRSENVKVGQYAERDDLHMYKLINENIDAQNTYTNWSSFYTVINRCNTAIMKAPKVAAVDPSFTEGELKATIAELSALRDLCYFYLIRTFRDVPYSTTAFTDDDQKMDLPATPFNDVLDSLITDLEAVQYDAVRKYPSDGDKALYQTGRITQDAIHAMLCEMYLWKQDYQKCIDYADMIIAAKQQEARDQEGTLMSDMNTYFDGYPLIREWTNEADFFGNSYNEIFGTGNSDESIFELTYMRNDNMLANSAVSTYYGNPDNGGFYNRVQPSDYIGLDVSNNVFKFFRNTLDARGHWSFNALTTTSTSSMIGKYVMSTSIWEASGTTVKRSLAGTWTKDKNHSNWIIYRLTDIMLMKAEALVQLAADDADAKVEEAFNLVNVVNRRNIMKEADKITANDQLKFADYNTKDKMEELVMEERHRELLFEGKRWYDLVRRSLRDGNTQYLRTQLGNKGLKNAGIVSSKLTRMEAIFWPYNLDELKVNHNLTQNPAFGSGENSSYENTATNQ